MTERTRAWKGLAYAGWARVHGPIWAMSAPKMGSAFVRCSIACAASKGRAGVITANLRLDQKRYKRVAKKYRDALLGKEFSAFQGQETQLCLDSARGGKPGHLAAGANKTVAGDKERPWI